MLKLTDEQKALMQMSQQEIVALMQMSQQEIVV